MHDDVDETIVRIAAALRPLPDVDPAQRARVLVAVAAERERERRKKARVARMVRVGGVMGGVIAASLLVTIWSRGGAIAPQERAGAVVTESSSTATAPATASANAALVAHGADGVALQPVQLVLRAPAAHRVSVVGDFNGWDAKITTMTRDQESGLWSQTLALRPGRHVYAFVVDDSVWMRDPRAPAANDADFGRPGSVLLVGRP